MVPMVSIGREIHWFDAYNLILTTFFECIFAQIF